MAGNRRQCQNSVTHSLSREEHKADARLHFSKGGSVSRFSKERDLPRSTVAGWKERWDKDKTSTVVGRPRRLPSFNEMRLLGSLFYKDEFSNWQSVRDAIKRDCGEELSRSSVFRCLKRWGIAAAPFPNDDRTIAVSRTCPGATENYLEAQAWVNPSALASGENLSGTIWRLFSRRGMEAFLIIHDDYPNSTQRVMDAVTRRYYPQSPRISTNSPDFAALLTFRVARSR